MKHHMTILTLALALTGCAQISVLPTEILAVPADSVPAVAPMVIAGQTAARLDTTTAAEKAAALAKPAAASEVDLGLMVVALGSPADAGFWLSAGAVSAPAKGRVAMAGGGSVAVDLRPGTGGALLSLAAFRALGLGLTDLPEVRVFAN